MTHLSLKVRIGRRSVSLAFGRTGGTPPPASGSEPSASLQPQQTSSWGVFTTACRRSSGRRNGRDWSASRQRCATSRLISYWTAKRSLIGLPDFHGLLGRDSFPSCAQSSRRTRSHRGRQAERRERAFSELGCRWLGTQSQIRRCCPQRTSPSPQRPPRRLPRLRAPVGAPTHSRERRELRGAALRCSLSISNGRT